MTSMRWFWLQGSVGKWHDFLDVTHVFVPNFHNFMIFLWEKVVPCKLRREIFREPKLVFAPARRFLNLKPPPQWPCNHSSWAFFSCFWMIHFGFSFENSWVPEKRRTGHLRPNGYDPRLPNIPYKTTSQEVKQWKHPRMWFTSGCVPGGFRKRSDKKCLIDQQTSEMDRDFVGR